MPHHNRHLMGHSEFFHGSRLICLPLNISEKLQARRGRDSSTSSLLMWYNTHAFWRTTSNIETSNIKQTGNTTIFSIGYQSCTWKRSGPSFWKKPCSGCNSEINLVVLLEYTFLQPYSNVEQVSLRFRKFRRSNVHHSVVVQSNHCQVALLFLLDVRCPKFPHSFFCDCLPTKIVDLRILFLLSTPVVQMLLTPRCVSRRKHAR